MATQYSIFYEETSQDTWKTSSSSQGKERFYQYVQLSSIDNIEIKSSKPIAILGFCCDEGVRRNGGRVGSFEGPVKIRESLKDIYVHLPNDLIIYDFGNVFCRDQNLEDAQIFLSKIIKKLISSGYIPFVFGGGHETAWASYQGLAHMHQKDNLGIVNFDAHFDLRPVISDKGNSGTPFSQIAEKCKKDKKTFDYNCLGLESHSNSKSLFEKAEELNTNFYLSSELRNELDKVLINLTKKVSIKDFLYVSICLDVLNVSYAPAVSAINNFGISPYILDEILRKIIDRQKILLIDLVELCPRFDLDCKTSKLAAILVTKIISYLCATKKK